MVTSTCPTTADINAKIAEVLQGLSPPPHGVPPNYNYSPDITSPLSPGFTQTIDHTLLKPDATDAQIDALCKEARQYGFKVCCYICGLACFRSIHLLFSSWGGGGFDEGC